jgi:uncharacterized protein
MATYRTPDVYVEEISVFPPSVAEVETAIPAFIGYTQMAQKVNAKDLILKPTEIYSLKEYENYFGFPKEDTVTVGISGDASTGFSFTVTEPTVMYLMYYSVKLFFDNGGGKCYIVSTGNYQTSPIIDLNGDTGTDPNTMYGLQDGLDAIALEDEPTLIVFPESTKLSSSDYQTLVQATLSQCAKLGDRFGVFDIFQGGVVLDSAAQSTNRGYFGANNLKYGAAYYPFIKSTFNFYLNAGETNVTVNLGEVTAITCLKDTADSLNGTYFTITSTTGGTTTTYYAWYKTSGGTLTDPAVASATGIKVSITTGDSADKVAKATALAITAVGGGSGGTKFNASATGANLTVTDVAIGQTTDATAGTSGFTIASIIQGQSLLSDLKSTDTAVYNAVKSELKNHFLVLPPSSAVVGVYAAVDTARGVWKAPANVSLADVIEPVIKLDNAHQDTLNIDSTGGKSINAIRAFAGKGTLIWGARTLAGNDNEWRYIPVRRFFIMVEESVKKSTYWAVFEPNDANTWVKVRGMIENYLTQKWREGALAGSTTKEAFFVRVGLGTTMNAQDILEGRMNVEIGMAVVRPAEFIILKFSHKLQTS